MSKSPSSISQFFTNVDPFLTEPKNSQLIIGKDGAGVFTFTSILLPNEGVRPSSQSKESIQYLKEIIGSKRLERILLNPDLDLKDTVANLDELVLTHDVVHKIFIGLGHVSFEDLQERAVARGLNLKDLRVEEQDAFYEELTLPISEVKNIFFKHCTPVKYLDGVESHGKGFKGLQERVWTVLKARIACIENENPEPISTLVSESEMLTSRFGDREPPIGTLVRLAKGYYVVERVFAKGGAYISVLAPLNEQNKKPLFVCRGTAASSQATGGTTSLLNDLQKEIGVLGIQSVWGDIKKYLEEEAIAEVDVLGKSLGGAHAQYLTVLIAGTTWTQVSSLTTYCSVSVPSKVQEIFTEIFSQESEKRPTISILRNSGDPSKNQVDYVPTVGGVHIHAPETHVYYIAPKEDELPSDLIPKVEGPFQKLQKLLVSFGQSHNRQTTLAPFKIVEVEKDKLETEVNRGKDFDAERSMLAGVLDFVSLGSMNRGGTFETFYNAEKH